MSYVFNALSLIVQTVFGLAATLFLLRLLAEAGRADFHNPLSQFIYRYTNPVLAPIRRVVPNRRRINLAALLVLWLILLLERFVINLLADVMPRPLGLLVGSVADLLDFVLLFYIVLIFAWSIASMLGASPYQPVMRLAEALVQPVLRPLRGKLVMGQIDFAPTVVVLVMLLARILIVAPLADLALRLSV